MSIWRQLTHGLRALFSREAADLEIRDEVRQFMDAAEAELIAGGATPEEARRTVRSKYGTAQAAREEVRSCGWESIVRSVLADRRYGARLLRRGSLWLRLSPR